MPLGGGRAVQQLKPVLIATWSSETKLALKRMCFTCKPVVQRTYTRSAVLAIPKNHVDTVPTLFTTYDTAADLHGCAIWEVARATSAATTFFKPIRVGRDGVEFVDAGFGHNNPCEVLIDEAQRQFPSRTRLQIVSIGTGLGDVVDLGNTRRDILSALKTMASTSKVVATRMNDRYGNSDQYFRLNVEKGLEDVTLSDWEKASTIAAHTRVYIRENRMAIEKIISHVSGCSDAIDARESPGGERTS